MQDPETLQKILARHNQALILIVMHWPTRKLLWLTPKEAEAHEDFLKHAWVYHGLIG
jgi:hypothetical protein